jgi:MFS family permease
MLVAGAAVLAAAPAGLLALLMPSGSLLPFIVLQGVAAFLMYIYYATTYATIHDIVEPALRGRAMAVYFFAMYMLGASLGPVVTGRLSDYFALRAARIAAAPMSEHFRAIGLHQAMYAINTVMYRCRKATQNICHLSFVNGHLLFVRGEPWSAKMTIDK